MQVYTQPFISAQARPAQVRRQLRRMWALASVVCITLLALHEGALRALGVHPQVQDTSALWSQHMHQLEANAPQPGSVALVGASRMLFNMHQPTLRAQLPGRAVYQLGVMGSAGLPTLEYLATHTKFAGTVVYSLHAGNPPAGNQQQAYVQYYRGTWAHNWGARYNAALAQVFQRYLALRCQGGLNPVTLAKQRTLPLPTWVYMQPGRFAHIQFSRMPAHKLQQALQENANTAHTTTPEAFARTLGAYFKPLVQQIQSRGGQVVFVRMPTSGKLRAYEAQHFPREAYWNRVSELTGAPSIHFEDIAQLPPHAVPDGSHVCASAQPFFTSALVSKALQLGAL